MKKKCCFEGCEKRGVPEPGYDFYACPECLDRMGELMDAIHAERMGLDPAGRKN